MHVNLNSSVPSNTDSTNTLILYQLKPRRITMRDEDKKRSGVRHLIVSPEYEGQRIDNFLVTHLKGMPKSRIYRIVRKGEVRVNSKRISPFYRLKEGDKLRLPPVYLEEKAQLAPPSKNTEALLASRILYEDDDLLIINKPCGMSVHLGNTVRVGVVEALRHMYPKLVHLELAHRLDSETSGCLILAKKRRVLRELHEILRSGQMSKVYWVLTQGKWKDSELRVEAPLHKHYRDGGKHVVEVSREGKSALTVFRLLKAYKTASLMEATLFTGRTHQIRVHAQFRGHPVAGDDRYGDNEFNKNARELGLKRMFLHAKQVVFTLPSTQQRITVEAPLDPELEAAIKEFEKRG
jgi:23S rRNA pseudouridine955/2504/2580 synthase